MRVIMILITVVALTGCDFIGGGDTVVKGNENVVVTDAVLDRVAEALAKLESTPTVSDEELAALYEKIRGQALNGDLDAALVVLKVAELQRTSERPE